MIKSKPCALSASENEVRICNNFVRRYFARHGKPCALSGGFAASSPKGRAKGLLLSSSPKAMPPSSKRKAKVRSLDQLTLTVSHLPARSALLRLHRIDLHRRPVPQRESQSII